jgi:hypothetical protein
MNQALLDSLSKQDDDLVILENREDSITVMTRLPIGDPIEEVVDPIVPTPSVNIQITRHFFAAQALILFFIPLFGIVPFYLLIELPIIVSYTLCGASLLVAAILHAALWWWTPEWALFPTYLLLIFNNFIVIVTLAATGATFAPFQGCAILFIECITVIIMCLCSNKKIDTIWCTLAMITTGLSVWSIGLYAFIKEHDWISAGMLFFFCVLFYPLLSGYKIYRINHNAYHIKEVLQLLCENPLKGAGSATDGTDSND